jgi:hypothetical protein
MIQGNQEKVDLFIEHTKLFSMFSYQREKEYLGSLLLDDLFEIHSLTERKRI